MRAAEDSSPLDPPDDAELRMARHGDVPDLVELVNRAFEHERWLIPGPRLREEDAVRELFDASVITMVASRDNKLVGTVRVRFAEASGEPLAIPELGLLAVHPSAQRLGIGYELVRAAELIARRAGFYSIELKCGRELGLETYYARLGYVPVAESYGWMFGSLFPFTLVTMRRQWPA